MEKFGGYGFNKSHSAAYALIAYQTAYLKAHFPVEFMAALLTSEMGAIDSVVKFNAECRSHDISVLPPDINTSGKGFTVDGEKILFGLVAVKNVGEGAIDAILDARKTGGPFASIFDFCERVDLKRVNKRVLESLIQCGAFDTTGAHRAQMTEALETALDYGQRVQKEKASPQMGLFDSLEIERQTFNPPALPHVPAWDNKQQLALEKESLGFYITGHPLDQYERTIGKFVTADALSLKETKDGEAVRIGGIITDVKTIRTKRGELMAFLTTEDMAGSVESTVFSSVYESTANLLATDTPVLIEGRLQKEENGVKIIADKIVSVEMAEETWTASIHIHLNITRTDRESLLKLRGILEKHKGTCPAYLHLVAPEIWDTLIAMPDTIQLRAGEGLSREVNGFLGYNAVELVCKSAEATAGARKGQNGRWARP
jgi:DNA polymerase-3 subunit alpha